MKNFSRQSNFYTTATKKVIDVLCVSLFIEYYTLHLINFLSMWIDKY